jgi:hypothetical protein
LNIAHDQSDGFFPALGLPLAKGSLEAEDTEISPARREFGGGDLLD